MNSVVNIIKTNLHKTAIKTQANYRAIVKMSDAEKALIEAGKKASAVQAVDENITKVRPTHSYVICLYL